jgi:hypothetical protein
VKRLIVCLAMASVEASPADEAKKAVRTYTNEDLARVAPRRAETGALSAVETGPPAAPGSKGDGQAARKAEEAHWRREAERVRERVRALARDADAIRDRIDAARRRQASPSPRRAGSLGEDGTASLERRLAAVLAEMRERQTDLEERARRAGALPGWLR